MLLQVVGYKAIMTEKTKQNKTKLKTMNSLLFPH